MTALSVALSLGAAGCTRTSDGSIIMRKPSFNLLHFREEEPARIVPSRTLTRPTSAPLPASMAGARHAPGQTVVTVAPMKIARNPPFSSVDPGKPLACRNVKAATGRIRVVCT
jgi:hypothetical protein